MAVAKHLRRTVDLLKKYEADKPVKLRGPALPLPEEDAAMAAQYLDAFGYTPRALADWTNISIADIIAAIKKFQGWFRLPRSGHLTPQTVKAMRWPRCGCPDIITPRHTEYAKVRAVVRANLAAWKKRGLTYGIQSYVSGIAKGDQDVIFQKAFEAWTQYGNLSVSRVSGAGVTPDIVITTGRGRGSNFDGPSGTLAYAYLPDGSDRQLRVVFDLDETWISNPNQRGILLFNVACHEFGHALGLDHSRVSAALMAPTYNQAIALPQANDDIPRFQARYGTATPPLPGKKKITIEVDGTVTGARVIGVA